MKKIYQLLILAFIVFLSLGCRSGSSLIVQKDLLPEEGRENKLYFVLMEYTSLHDLWTQGKIYSNTAELLKARKLHGPDLVRSDYIVLGKLQEFRIISASARFSHGTLAGTDILETEVVVVKADTLKSKRFEELYKQVIPTPIPGLLHGLEKAQQKSAIERQKIAQVLFSMDEAHLIKKTVQTVHRSPATIQIDDFIRRHSQVIVTSVVGK